MEKLASKTLEGELTFVTLQITKTISEEQFQCLWLQVHSKALKANIDKSLRSLNS